MYNYKHSSIFRNISPICHTLFLEFKFKPNEDQLLVFLDVRKILLRSLGNKESTMGRVLSYFGQLDDMSGKRTFTLN